MVQGLVKPGKTPPLLHTEEDPLLLPPPDIELVELLSHSEVGFLGWEGKRSGSHDCAVISRAEDKLMVGLEGVL